MSSFDIARWNPLASLIICHKTVVEAGHELPATIGGVADWSRASACRRVLMRPAIVFHESKSLRRRIFFHEVGHHVCGHVAVGNTFDPRELVGRDAMPLAVRARHPAYIKREQEAEQCGEVLSEWWSHVDLDDLAYGYQKFDPTRLPEPLNSVVKGVLLYLKEREAEKAAARAWAEKQLQRAAPLPSGVYAFKTYAAHIGSSAFA
jgi:hypothetical protein